MMLLPETGYSALADPATCEMCGTQVPQANIHSIVLLRALPNTYQCQNNQHYGCCEEHAVLAALACYFEHVKNHPFPGQGIPNVDSNYIQIQNIVNQYVVANIPADPTLP